MTPGDLPVDSRGVAGPVLRIVRGIPEDVDASREVAVLTAVLASVLAAGDGGATPAPLTAWASRERLVRRPLHPGPDGWRASALPG